MSLPIPRNPLVLTLSLDRASQTFLTDLRAKYFPRHRNHLNAHVTLFHAIPPHRINQVDDELSSICHSTPPWEVFIGDPRKMGNRGVMVMLRDRPRESTEKMHRHLLKFLKKGIREGQEGEKDKLTNQDMMGMSKSGAHVTVLNKAEGEEEVERCLKEVKELFEGMKKEGEQFGQQKGKAVGFELWEYQGGPWRSIKRYEFQDKPA